MEIEERIEDTREKDKQNLNKDWCEECGEKEVVWVHYQNEVRGHCFKCYENYTEYTRNSIYI